MNKFEGLMNAHPRKRYKSFVNPWLTQNRFD